MKEELNNTAGEHSGGSHCSTLIDLAIRWYAEAEIHDADGAADCGTGSDVPYAMASKCREHAREIEEIAYVLSMMECENSKLHDDLDRLLEVETAARQCWKAKGRHNSQIAFCNLGEALGYPVTWPEGYNLSNVRDHRWLAAADSVPGAKRPSTECDAGSHSVDRIVRVLLFWKSKSFQKWNPFCKKRGCKKDQYSSQKSKSNFPKGLIMPMCIGGVVGFLLAIEPIKSVLNSFLSIIKLSVESWIP